LIGTARDTPTGSADIVDLYHSRGALRGARMRRSAPIPELPYGADA